MYFLFYENRLPSSQLVSPGGVSVVVVVVVLGGNSVVVELVVDVVLVLLVDVVVVVEGGNNVVVDVVVVVGASEGVYKYTPIPLGRQKSFLKLLQFIILLLWDRVHRFLGTCQMPSPWLSQMLQRKEPSPPYAHPL